MLPLNFKKHVDAHDFTSIIFWSLLLYFCYLTSQKKNIIVISSLNMLVTYLSGVDMGFSTVNMMVH